MYAQQYVVNDLLDRSPVELIRLLYSKAIDKLRQAVRHTRAGDVRERGMCLARVMEIVAQLHGALNTEDGGVLAADLARLYDYMQQRLIEAAADPSAVQQLDEVNVLLGNLYEGWSDCEPPGPAPDQHDSTQTEPVQASAETERSGDEMPSAGALPSPVPPAGYSGSHGNVWTL